MHRLIILFLAPTLACAKLVKKINADRQDDWNFALKPLYLWGITLVGSTTISPYGNEGEFFILTDNSGLTGAFTINFELGHNRWHVFANNLFSEWTYKAKEGALCTS